MGPEPDLTSDVPGMAIWGWHSPDELLWLMSQAKSMSSVVEVGCLHGRSSFALLTACSGPVFCIDAWNDEGYASFMSNCGHFPNLVAMRESSPAIASDARFNHGVDMVYLDGDHDLAAVHADIEAWFPLTRKLLCGHDYTVGPDGGPGGFPGVKEAVDEAFGDRAVVAEGTAIWTVRV